MTTWLGTRRSIQPTSSIRTRRTGARGVSVAVGATCALLIGLCTGGLGCSDDDARLESAAQALSQARADLAARQQALEREESELEQARAERDEAREAVDEAERRVAEAQSQVEEQTTDEVVFRSVQERLLGDPALQHVAIAARVNDGVVGLYGHAPDKRTRSRAGEIAQGTLGVIEVQNHITIEVPAVSAER